MPMTPEERQQKLKEEPFRNLSRHQYGSLKFINDNNVTLEYLRVAHATTLSSLAYRGYIAAVGPGEKATVSLTKLGQEALRKYDHATLNERSHEGEMTERTLRLLRHSRRVTPMPKSA